MVADFIRTNLFYNELIVFDVDEFIPVLPVLTPVEHTDEAVSIGGKDLFLRGWKTRTTTAKFKGGFHNGLQEKGLAVASRTTAH